MVQILSLLAWRVMKAMKSFKNSKMRQVVGCPQSFGSAEMQIKTTVSGQVFPGFLAPYGRPEDDTVEGSTEEFWKRLFELLPTRCVPLSKLSASVFLGLVCCFACLPPPAPTPPIYKVTGLESIVLKATWSSGENVARGIW